MTYLSPIQVVRRHAPPPSDWTTWTARCDRCDLDATWRQKAPLTGNTRAEVDCPACGDSDTGRDAA